MSVSETPPEISRDDNKVYPLFPNNTYEAPSPQQEQIQGLEAEVAHQKEEIAEQQQLIEALSHDLSHLQLAVRGLMYKLMRFKESNQRLRKISWQHALCPSSEEDRPRHFDLRGL